MIKPYYEEDGITIYCGDCRDVLPTLAKVDLVLTDPPYGVTACEWDDVIPLDVMWNAIANRMTTHGVVVMTSKQPFTTRLIASNMKAFKYCWVWEKNRATNFYNAERQPLTAHEDIIVWGSGKSIFNPQKTTGHPPTNSATGRSIGEVYNGENKRDYSGGDTDRYPRSVIKFDCERGYHPTQKPIALMAYLIKTYAADDATVLDFAMGSGTTLVAAKQLGRRCIGVELSEACCEIAVQRLRQGVLPL